MTNCLACSAWLERSRRACERTSLPRPQPPPDGQQANKQRNGRHRRSDELRAWLEAELDRVRAGLDRDRSEERVGNEHARWLLVDAGNPATMVEVLEHHVTRRIGGRGDAHEGGAQVR